FKRIDIGLNFRTLLEKKIDLFELTFSEPQFHIIVGPDGKTNLPALERSPTNFDFETSIQNFNILGGSALINERQVQIDLSLKNLAAVLDFQGVRQVLRTHLRYDGIFDHASSNKPIPYTFAGDLDYTRATLIAHSIVLKTGPSEIRLQGKIE